MTRGRTHQDDAPRNAWAAARSGRQVAVHASIDPHNARFLARYIVSMLVLFVAVVAFCFLALAIVGGMRERAATVLPAIPLDLRYSR